MVRSGMAIRAFAPLPPPPVTLDRSAASEPAAAPPVAPTLLRSGLGLARPAVLPAAAVAAEPAEARRCAAPVVVRSSKDPPPPALPAPLPGLSLSTETGLPSVDEEDTRLTVPALPAPLMPPPRALSTETDRCRKEGPWLQKPEAEGCLAAAASDGDGERRTLLVEAQRPATAAAAEAGRSGSRRPTEPRSSADARMAAPLPPPPPMAEMVCLVWAPPVPRGEAAETRPPKATLTPLLILLPPWWW